MAQAPFISLRAVTVVLLVVIGLIIFYNWFNPEPGLPSRGDIAKEEEVIHQLQKESFGLLGMSNWEEIKKEALASKVLKVTDGKIDIAGKATAFRREVVDTTLDAPKGVFLLLHGMRFTSKTWLELGTLHVMASYGYRMVAVDLPGYGETDKIKDMDPVAFITAVLETVKASNVIIISPSMSGMYSLPFLMAHPEKFAGYVPVAPVNTEKYSPEDYKKVEVPTLIIYGAKDTSLGETSLNNLRHIPNSEIQKLDNAGHPCYLDQPLVFHKHVQEFTQRVFSPK